MDNDQIMYLEGDVYGPWETIVTMMALPPLYPVESMSPLHQIKKIKKPLSCIIFSQNGGCDRSKKREKNSSPEFRSYLAQGRKIRKKSQKNSKN